MSRHFSKRTLPANVMQIVELELSLLQFAQGAGIPPVRSLIVRLVADDGLEGWGEAPSTWKPDELAGRTATLRASIVGRSVFDLEELLTLDVLQNSAVRCAVEMAAWDLIGQRAGMPLYHLFGGAYRRRVPVAIRLRARNPLQVAKQAAELAQQGYHAQILTGSGYLDNDLALLRAVREAIGDRAELRLDGSGRFDTEGARDLCAALEFESVAFLLDPLSVQPFHATAALARQTSVPLAVSRSITCPNDVLAVIRSGAASHVALRMPALGGLLSLRKTAAIAEAAGLKTLADSGPSVGIATAAMLQLAAALPVLDGCNECNYPQLQDDLLTERLELVDGMITVPQGPGLGISVDRAKLEQYQAQ